MDVLLGCATGRCGLGRSHSTSGRRVKASSGGGGDEQRREPSPTLPTPPPPQEVEEVCLAGWLTKSPEGPRFGGGVGGGGRGGGGGGGSSWLVDRLSLKRLSPQWKRFYFVLTRTAPAPLSHEMTEQPPQPQPPAARYQLRYYNTSDICLTGQPPPAAGRLILESVRRIGTLTPPPVRLARTLSRRSRIRLQRQQPFLSLECNRGPALYLLAESLAEMQRWADHLAAATAATAASGGGADNDDNDVEDDVASTSADSGLGRRTLEMRRGGGAKLDEPDGGGGGCSRGRRADSGCDMPGCHQLAAAAAAGASSGGVNVGDGGSLESISSGCCQGTCCAEAESAHAPAPPPAPPQTPQPHHQQSKPYYATLDLASPVRPVADAAATSPGPVKVPNSNQLMYLEIDRVRTQALAEIGAAAGFRLRAPLHSK